MRALAPWRWMAETDIFAVRAGPKAEPVFVSVMGETGQHFAIGAYLGVAAFHDFVALQSTEEEEPERLLEIPQLQLSFADRRKLEPEDLASIRSLALEIRGRRAWPMFPSFRPGHVPWFLEPGQVTVFAPILEQVLDVAPRARSDKTVLWPPGQGHHVLARVQRADRSWEDQIEAVGPPPVRAFSVDTAVTNRLRKLPPSATVVEADLFVIPGTVQEEAEAPSLIYSAMLVESASGFILGAELFEPRPSSSSIERTPRGPDCRQANPFVPVAARTMGATSGRSPRHPRRAGERRGRSRAR